MASVIGLGFVGSAIMKSFALNNVTPLYGYDKFKDGGVGCFDDCLQCPLMFLCLPTPYNEHTKRYDKKSIFETLEKLQVSLYRGLVVIKSTVEPGSTEEYAKQFPTLSVCHNPEFLSAATAFNDFHNQKHIVIGRGSNCEDMHVDMVYDFYHDNYPSANISICTATESESMKAFVNTFYAVKIQYFNELYLLCAGNAVDYDNVKDLMLKNGWINPMHTTVPGRDGKLSYGGGCFPKDTNALLEHMKKAGTPHAVLEACIEERNSLRGEASKCTSNAAHTPETTSNCTPAAHTPETTNSHLPNSKKIVNGICNAHFENGHFENGHLQNGNLENGHLENGHLENKYFGNTSFRNGHPTNGYH